VAKLEQLHPDLAWPSHSTTPRDPQAGWAGVGPPCSSSPAATRRGADRPAAANHVWAVDHKGWITLGDGQRCEPLTLADTHSRFVLAISAGEGAHEAQARPVMQRAFQEHGLPEVMRSDNGPPFASASPSGLSRLSVWWIKLGVRPERILPGRPQENGRLERFHLTLLEAMRPACADRAAQALRFEAFRHDYNHERPHQALGQLPPARFYSPSPRQMPRKLPEPDYPSDRTVRKVRSNGQIKLQGDMVHISSALAGEAVALQPIEQGWRVWFYKQPIGLLDHRGQKLLPIQQG
jgi:transposase InsO family protein